MVRIKGPVGDCIPTSTTEGERGEEEVAVGVVVELRGPTCEGSVKMPTPYRIASAASASLRVGRGLHSTFNN